VSGVIRRLWRFIATLFAVVVILAAVLVGLLRLALVQLPEYRSEIEARAGRALGWPLEIGTMDARLGLRGPELRFADARVLTQERDRTLVRAATGAMRFDLLALLRGQLRPGEVTLAGVALRIERDVDGQWRLLGEDGPVLASGDAALADGPGLPQLDTLPEGRLRLEGVELEFEDLRRSLGPWLFVVDDLSLSLDGRELALAATGQLPPALGAEVALSLVLTGQDERGWPSEWTAGMTLGALELAGLGTATGHAGLQSAAGTLEGSLYAAADGGGLARVAGELGGRNLQLPRPLAMPGEDSDGQAPGLPYQRLGTSFEWIRAATGWHLKLADLEVRQGARRWTSASVAVTLEQDETVRRLEGRADRLELDELAAVAPWLPGRARALVEQLAPTGTVRELELHLDLPHEAGRLPNAFLAAKFERVSVQAIARWPAIENLSGRLSGDTWQGSGEIAALGTRVTFPTLFRQPIEVAAGAAQVEWQRDEAGVRVRFSRVTLENDDALVEASLTVRVPGGGASPELQMEARVERAGIAAIGRYLPVERISPKVVAWLDRALRAGAINDARVEFDGPTRAFPFRGGEGRFTAGLTIAGGELEFDPGWPLATDLEASVRFENAGLRAEVSTARALGISAEQLRVAIPDLREGQLRLQGRTRGSLTALRRFALAADDLEAILGAGLAPATVSGGRALADIDLELPLLSVKNFRARIGLEILDGEISYGFLGEPLHNLDAFIDIDNTRVTSRRASATLAGWPLTGVVSVTDSGAVRFDVGGRLDSDALARVLRLPLEEFMSGTAALEGSLRFPAPGSEDVLEAEVSSNLEGVTVMLPEPLRKRPDESQLIVVRARFPERQITDSEFEWEHALRVSARVDHSGPAPVLLAVPGALPGNPVGLVISGAVQELDLGQWLAFKFPRQKDTGGVEDWLAGGRLLVGELTAPLVRVEDLLLDLRRGANRWHLGLSGDRVEGQLELPFTMFGDDPLVARLSRLWVGAADDEPGDDVAEDASPVFVSPSRVPPLDIEIDDFRFGGVRLGSVTARVLHEGDGIDLVGLEALGNGFIIQAEGRSRLGPGIDESRLNLRMRSDNVGATQEFMGFRRSMDSPDGLFEAEVSWTDGLRSDWLSAIEGTGKIAIRNGTLVGVEPGAGRVFGLLSIQALPRRLALDFKDVFGEGTRFDRVTGDFRFEGGSAYTENLLMQGPAADIVVVGRTGLVARDYDQTAVIAADLGRAFPVAGTVVAGPAVGAALFLLSEVLRKPFQTHITYRMTGSWDDPVIEKVAAGSLSPQQAAPTDEEPD
jgi:uncharacterized protein (TIGR02099 family)